MKKRYYVINIVGGLLLAAILFAVVNLIHEKAQYSKPFMVLDNIDFSNVNEYSGKLNVGFKTETNAAAIIVSGKQTMSDNQDFDAAFFINDSTGKKNYFHSDFVLWSECFYNGANYRCQYFSGVPIGIHDFKLIIKKPSKILNKPVTILIVPVCEFLGLKIQFSVCLLAVFLFILLVYNLIHVCYKYDFVSKTD